MPALLAPTLSWVKPEVDHALKTVRENIARFLADPEAVALLKKCPEQIHQVTGALNILGLDGAVRFSETVEQAFAGITAQPVIKPSMAGTLDRAVHALKEFIDSLAKGGSNAPVRLFPLYKEISGLAGKAGVAEKDLFFPDLTAEAPANAASATVSLDKLPGILQAQRSRFQRGLLTTLRTPDARDGLKEMHAALEALDAVSAQLPEAFAGFYHVQTARIVGHELLVQLHGLGFVVVNGLGQLGQNEQGIVGQNVVKVQFENLV